MLSPKTHIIIGSSAAGLSAAATLMRHDKDARIICISHEIEPPYNKCLLVDYVSADQQRQDVLTLKTELANNPNFKLLLGATVVNIDPQAQSITLRDTQVLHYDTLFMSMGSSAYKPTLPGINAAGIFTFYTLADSDTMLAWIAQHAASKALVIGGGLNGLECANALASRGLAVTLIERGARVLAHHTDEQGSEYIIKAADAAGVIIKTATEIVEIRSSDERVTGVVCLDGSFVAADLVIFAIGMHPNSKLASQAGILLQGQHVKVDNRLQTNISNIFAGGDVVAAPCAVTGLLVPSTTWPDAVLQGSIAAYNMMKMVRAYPGVIGHTVSHFFGLEFAACGIFNEMSLQRRRVIVEKPGSYFIFELDNNILQAYSLIGASVSSAAMVCRRALLTKQPIAEPEFQLL